MTNKEAAYILSDKCHEYTLEELHTAFDLAIKALEEIDRLKKSNGEWVWVGLANGDKFKWACSLCCTCVEHQVSICPTCGANMKLWC